MGIIRRGILGGFSGKVANVVGSSWKGISVMKSLPLSVANPRTAGQVAQRTKFANVVALATSILTTIIKPMWDRFAQRESGYNAFIRKNIDLFENEIPSPMSELVISEGKLQAGTFDNMGINPGTNAAAIGLASPAGDNLALDSDEIFALVYNETKDEWVALPGYEMQTRAMALVAFTPEKTWEINDVYHIWGAYRRKDGTIVGNTAYKTGSLIGV